MRMPLGLNVEKKKDQMHMVYEVVSDKSRRLIITAGLGFRVSGLGFRVRSSLPVCPVHTPPAHTLGSPPCTHPAQWVILGPLPPVLMAKY